MSLPLKELTYAVKTYYPNAERTEQIIINCALTAAGANVVGGIIPGLAVPATIVSCVGAVWTMYVKLCRELKISLTDNALKLIARAAVSNIAANLGSVIAASFIGLFIPGASILAAAAVGFVTVYLAGIIFLQLILKLAAKSSDRHSFSDITVSEMEQEASNVTVTKDDLLKAKAAYKAHK